MRIRPSSCAALTGTRSASAAVEKVQERRRPARCRAGMARRARRLTHVGLAGSRQISRMPSASSRTPFGSRYVPRGSAAYAAGVRPGWRLATLDDELPDAAGWLERTAAPPHSRPALAGRRLLAGPAGVPRLLTALDVRGNSRSWQEALKPGPPEPAVSWRRLDSGAGYLRVAAWLDDVDEAIDAALHELRGCESLVVDLRRNPGGSLVAACRTRDRFVRASTTLGSIRHSLGAGRLSEPTPLLAEPTPLPRSRRAGPAGWSSSPTSSPSPRARTSYSDSRGFEHVRVVGTPSGGGSGRPRMLRLLPGWTLTVSTALTFDRNGRCIEGAGLPVDVHVPPSLSRDRRRCSRLRRLL